MSAFRRLRPIVAVSPNRIRHGRIAENELVVRRILDRIVESCGGERTAVSFLCSERRFPKHYVVRLSDGRLLDSLYNSGVGWSVHIDVARRSCASGPLFLDRSCSSVPDLCYHWAFASCKRCEHRWASSCRYVRALLFAAIWLLSIGNYHLFADMVRLFVHCHRNLRLVRCCFRPGLLLEQVNFARKHLVGP
jgi:hypothetical protein